MTSAPSVLHQQALGQLLERVRLQPPEVASYLDKAQDPAYWTKLMPDLSVSDNAGFRSIEETPIAPQMHE